MSRYKEPIKEVGNCRVYHENYPVSVTEFNIKEYSKFCSDKGSISMDYLSSGTNGIIYHLKIDGQDYVLKHQIIKLRNSFSSLEKEISLANDFGDLMRRDGQRISINVFDCFFICDKNKLGETSCDGNMYYIMEKGIGSVESMITKTDSVFSNISHKSVLVRDTLTKIIENINLLVYEKNIVWWDLKPGNSVFNFKLNLITGKVDINPIFIDLDERYMVNSFDKLLDKDKLNYLLGNYDVGGSPVFRFKLEDKHLKKLYSYIMCFSYVFMFGDILTHYRQRISLENYDLILGLSIFSKKREDDETILPYDILRIMFNPTREELWLNTALQILLRTDYADSIAPGSSSYIFRVTFFHYNAFRARATENKFDHFYARFKDLHKKGMKALGEENDFQDTRIYLGELRAINDQMTRGDTLRRFIDGLTEERSDNSYDFVNNAIPSHEVSEQAVTSARSRGSRFLSRILGK